MKKIICFFFIFSVLNYAFCGNPLTEMQARKLLLQASQDDEKADEYYENLKDASLQKSAVLLGYKGMAELMICHHSYNPYTKYKYFLKGKKSLELAIKTDPSSVELHYLRYCVQTNAPFFLDYYSNKNEDKTILIKFLRNAKNENDKDLLRIVKEYFLKTGHCTEEEKKEIMKIIL